jgi:predicted kinase
MNTELIQTQFSEWITWIQEDYPHIVADMRQCSHHYSPTHLNGMHLEGDIWTHTMMVLQSYIIAGNNDRCVGLTALLHDIGKPVAMFEKHDRKRRIFRGHEALSAWMSWSMLQSPRLNLTNEQQIRIFALIALHGSLYQKWFGEQTLTPKQMARSFSGFGIPFWQQLMQQIRNDMRGQVTTNSGMKGNLMALEQPVIDAIVALEAQSTPEVLHKTEKLSFIMLIGVPGSGKSSYRTQLPSDAIIFSRDDLLHTLTNENHYRKAWEKQISEGLSNQIDQQLQASFRQAINEQRAIVIDMTNLTRKSRAEWLSYLPDSYHKQALVFIIDDQSIYQRNLSRGHKVLPENVIKEMLMKFEHPLFDEFDEIAYIIEQQIYSIT